MMTQYTDEVFQHGLMLEAIEWAQKVKTIHVHGLTSMYYETNPEDFEGGKSVTDVEYNSGIIKRSQDGKHVRTIGIMPHELRLVDMYTRS